MASTAEAIAGSLAATRSVATAAMKAWVAAGPLIGARVSNRCALALISLALDEVDVERRSNDSASSLLAAGLSPSRRIGC
jgi:hypothetical protein